MTASALVILCAGGLLFSASLPCLSIVWERWGMSGTFRIVSPHIEIEHLDTIYSAPLPTQTHPGLVTGVKKDNVDMKCWNHNGSWQIKFLSLPLCTVVSNADIHTQLEPKGLPLHGLLTTIFLLALHVQKSYFSIAFSLLGDKQKYSLDRVLTWNNVNFDIRFYLINEIWVQLSLSVTRYISKIYNTTKKKKNPF